MGDGALRWELHDPPGEGRPEWLARVCAFRARALYDGGRRPAFKDAAERRVVPPKPLDAYGHQVLAFDDDDLVGCWRLLPLDAPVTGTVEQVMGAEVLDTVLERLGTSRSLAGEGGGWAVAPRLRHAGVGLRLWAAGAALARSLGRSVTVAAVGTRDGQVDALVATGGRRHDEFGTRPSLEFADDLCLGTFQVVDAAPGFLALIGQMADVLALAAR